MTSDDWALLCAHVRKPDEASLTQLFDRHASWLYAAARRRLRDDHLAEDVVQAVFVILIERAKLLAAAEPRSIAAWLFQVMHLACGRLRRTRQRQSRREHQAFQIERESEAEPLPPDDLLLVLEDAIAALPPVDRQAVIQRFYLNAAFASIGETLGISAEAARKRVKRGLSTVRAAMLRDGIDVIPDELLTDLDAHKPAKLVRSSVANSQTKQLAKGTSTMMQQIEAIDFAVMSAEFVVSDVEISLDFFEKLGFRRHFSDTPDAQGRLPRASLRGGQTARIWLRRAESDEGTRPTPGVNLFFWINGGADALAAHRAAIAAQGVAVSPYNDDLTLRNFTVVSPDGYQIGFFTAYK